MSKSLLQKVVVDFRSDSELRGALWALAYGFCILCGYNVLRPVRDEISTVDRGNLQILWTVVFVVMLLAVPAYSWITTRYSRGVFVPLANRFFIACLLGFWACLTLMPLEARPWIDRVFYVWVSVFVLFVVTVFWGLVADCFSSAQGKRLFGFIAVGSSLGGVVGSFLTGRIADDVPTFALLLIAIVPLEIASWCARALHRGQAKEQTTRTQPEEPLAGSAWSGVRLVFGSPYLLGIAAFIFLLTFVSTVLYFQQSYYVYEAIADRGERTVLLANINLATQSLTFVIQVFLAARIIRWLGVGASLALVPALAAVGFVVLGLYPTLGVFVVVQVLYSAGRYGITKPAREILFTVVSREERFKSKAFLDAAVYRGGDVVNAWVYAGFTALGLSLGAIALVAVPVLVIWAGFGSRLGKREEEIAAAQEATRQEGRELVPA